MVEGGARIIQSFLSEHLVDALIVTTAPVIVGGDGVGYSEGFQQLPGLKYIHRTAGSRYSSWAEAPVIPYIDVFAGYLHLPVIPVIHLLTLLFRNLNYCRIIMRHQ
jgi:hypothetical protein